MTPSTLQGWLSVGAETSGSPKQSAGIVQSLMFPAEAA